VTSIFIDRIADGQWRVKIRRDSRIYKKHENDLLDLFMPACMAFVTQGKTNIWAIASGAR
jgi:hypothetical protein